MYFDGGQFHESILPLSYMFLLHIRRRLSIMLIFDFHHTNREAKNTEIYKSKGGNVTLYDVVFLKGNGISAHTHPFGEDCAFILDGVLDYFISNEKTIKAYENEVVFGWKNVIHGYINNDEKPLHLLIFVSPNQIGLHYPSDTDSNVIHLNEQERKLKPTNPERKESEFSSFQFVDIEGEYMEEVNKGEVVIFIEIIEKQIYIFDNEPVTLYTESPKRFLKYHNV